MNRLFDKYKNQTEVFRFLDVRGKGKIKKQDFIVAMEKLRVSLARDDITAVFKKIDLNSTGELTYQDLCAASNKLSTLDSRSKVKMEEKI